MTLFTFMTNQNSDRARLGLPPLELGEASALRTKLLRDMPQAVSAKTNYIRLSEDIMPALRRGVWTRSGETKPVTLTQQGLMLTALVTLADGLLFNGCQTTVLPSDLPGKLGTDLSNITRTLAALESADLVAIDRRGRPNKIFLNPAHAFKGADTHRAAAIEQYREIKAEVSP